MTRLRLRGAAVIALAAGTLLASLAGVLPSTSASALSLLPATPVGAASDSNIVQPFYPYDLVWFSAMDPNGPAKLLVTISPNNVTPSAVSINLTTPAGTYSNLLDLGASLWTETYSAAAGPSISDAQLSFSRESAATATTGAVYHLKIDDLGIVADLTYAQAEPGGAMQPIDWDGQLVYWSSSIGTASVRGTIQFPGDAAPTPITGWVGEEERMAGYFEHLAGHVGYEYAQSGNPDGSADQLFAFPELDGSWRGILAHTPAPGGGPVQVCADPTVALSNTSSIDGYSYPGTVQASCGGRSVAYTVSTAHMFPSIAEATTMSDGSSVVTNPDGTTYRSGPHGATIQHLRDLGTGFLGLQIGGLPTELPGLLAPVYGLLRG